MKKKRAITLATVVVVIVIVAFWPGQREPRYKGMTLSYWILNSQWSEQEKEAKEAVRHIGTNALPFLIKWIKHEPWYERRSFRFVQKLPTILLESRVLGQLVGYGRDLNERGARGFEVLGSQASPAIAELKRIVADPRANPDGAAGGAMYALSCIGEPAFPALKAMMKDSRSAMREQAIVSIAVPSRLGTNTMAAVLLVCEALEDADSRVAAMAAHYLNQFPEQADITVPALMRSLTNSDRLIRQRCVTTLSTYGNRAKAVVPELTAMLHDSDFTIRVIVTNALQQIAPEVLTNGVSK